MRQLNVQLDDDDATQLEAAALACGIDTAHLTKAQLVLLLEVCNTPAASVSGSPPGAGAPDNDAENSAVVRSDEEAARQRRLAALMPSQGIWKGDPDKPQDGLAYQNKARAEWR